MDEEEYRKEDEIPSCLDVCPTCNNELPLSRICPACGPTDDQKGGTHEGLDIEVRKAIDEAFEEPDDDWQERQDAYVKDYFIKVMAIAKETGVPLMKAITFAVHESLVSFMMADLGENGFKFLLRVATMEGNPVTPEQEKAYRERIALAKRVMEKQIDGSAHE